MRKARKMGIAAVMLTAGAAVASAQDRVEASASADFVSQYVWRGQDLGGISVQPSLGLSWRGLSLTAWGNVGFDSGDTKELDLTLGYSVGGFNVGVTDYWFNSGPDERYFYYGAHSTAHVFEATNFAGNDYKPGDDGSQKHAYSSYVELSAPFRLGGMEWLAAVGAVPYEASAIYADVDGFAVTNVSLRTTKEVAVTPRFTVPLFASVSANPATQKAYFACGFTLRP